VAVGMFRAISWCYLAATTVPACMQGSDHGLRYTCVPATPLLLAVLLIILPCCSAYRSHHIKYALRTSAGRRSKNENHKVRVFPGHNGSGQCPKIGKKGQNGQSAEKKYLVFAGHASGHSRGPGGHNLARKPGHDGGLDLIANSPHLRNLHAAFVLLETSGRNKRIPAGDPAKQRSRKPYSANAQLTNSKNTQAWLLLRLAKSRLLAARVRTSGLWLAATSPKRPGGQKPSRRLTLTSSRRPAK
jgi:hypothetical protein